MTENLDLLHTRYMTIFEVKWKTVRPVPMSSHIAARLTLDIIAGFLPLLLIPKIIPLSTAFLSRDEVSSERRNDRCHPAAGEFHRIAGLSGLRRPMLTVACWLLYPALYRVGTIIRITLNVMQLGREAKPGLRICQPIICTTSNCLDRLAKGVDRATAPLGLAALAADVFELRSPS